MKIFIGLLSFLLPLFAVEPITPIPQKSSVSPQKAALGKKLFFDPLLSKKGTYSCAHCHILSKGGSDNRPTPIYRNRQSEHFNTPTLWNSRFNFSFYWDGRAETLQEQAKRAIQNPQEMNNSFKQLLPKLRNSAYKAQFNKLYKAGISPDTIANALAAFEKTLITPNAPFDRFLNGDTHALTAQEQEGYALFKSKGCISCHHGRNIGGNMYSTFGVYQERSSPSLGRYNVTKNIRDKYAFKVPSLRNIALTAPYYHDGSIPTLKLAIELMAQLQLGRFMTPKEVNAIYAFLLTLNGHLPEAVFNDAK